MENQILPTFNESENAEVNVPHSVVTEQALLGLILLDNNRFDDVEGFLKKEHFYIKFHAEVFENIAQILTKGFEASPLTLYENMKSSHDKDGDLKDYLVGIMESATLAQRTKELAEIIQNYYQQRQLMAIGADISSEASDIPPKEQEEKIKSIISETESKLFKLSEFGTSTTAVTDLREPLKGVIEQIESAKRNKGELTGVTSGLHNVDSLTGGFQNSDLIILAARPSMGKTAFAVNIAQNAARSLMNNRKGGAAVAVFSMEMSAEQLAARILSSEAKINSMKLQDGSLDDEEFQRLVAVSNTLYNMKILIDDTPQLPIAALRSRARRMKRQHDIGMIIVDYLQLMTGSARKGENRVQEISEISQGLKAVARELNVPVIALSQLSRSVESRENKRPMLSDLRESGSIEQDADIVMFLYREDYYLEKSMGTDPTPEAEEKLNSIKGIAEILVNKNRKGPTGSVKLTFIPEYTTFKDYENKKHLEQYGENI